MDRFSLRSGDEAVAYWEILGDYNARINVYIHTELQKTAGTTADLTGNKIADKIVSNVSDFD